MGKSKSGGTRSYIRGRVGADVYSIGRDAKGKKQQIVRSLAETVANPQTQNQMRGRMIMSTIMQVVAGLKPVIDHSFDNVSGKQPNISEFIARNYGLIKADIAANPSSGNSFGLSMYGVKGAKQGQYVISDGKAVLPAAIVLAQSTGTITIAMSADALTIADLKSLLGLSSSEYFTIVGIGTDGNAYYKRFRVNPNLEDTAVVSTDSIGSVFATEGNASVSVSFAANTITIVASAVAQCCAVIVSKQTTEGYIHNKAVLGDGTDYEYTSSVALPTYPIGSVDYLNGGDIFGDQESFSPGGGDTPTPSPTSEVLTINGSAVTIGGSQSAEVGNISVSFTPDSTKSYGGRYLAYKVGSTISDLGSNAISTSTISGTIPSNMATAGSVVLIGTAANSGDQFNPDWSWGDTLYTINIAAAADDGSGFDAGG